MSKSGFVLWLSVLVSAETLCGAMPEVTIDRPGRSFTIQTERLEATFRDGRIVHLRNLLTGELIADEQLAETSIPSGLGHLSGGVAAMSKIHSPWGTLGLADALTANYHFPATDSAFTCERTGQGVLAEWSGLQADALRFPEETLRIEAETDANGALVFRASATSPTGGVFGVTVPLVNLRPAARFFLPSFGGMMFDANIKPALRTFGEAPFNEAPAMAVECGRGSLALWKEDGEFYPYFTYFSWSGKSFAFAFEHLNLMPFDSHKRVDSVSWRLDVTDGGWIKALTPYKRWYAAHFAQELKIREGVDWADKIRVVIDDLDPKTNVLERVTTLFPPETILRHEWNARAPEFDTDLPDWTPRKGYIDAVGVFHKHKIKTMAYVNTYCAEYNSPVWKRDNLSKRFLTRKYSLGDYGKASKDRTMNALIGDVQGPAAADQFAGIKDGHFFYGDPLHSGWRNYHAEQMVWWQRTTGTDANYEDTAGCAGDFGNGVIEGKFGAQGSVAMMRELLERQPEVPMASEYGPDAIAFAVKWPLVYAQVWGGEEFRAHRKHAQFPVNAYLFGYRIWMPTINAGTDLLKHVVTACSDAAGGMGMASASLEALACRSGFTGHMTWRAELFARRGLTPFFDPSIREPNLVCMYQDNAGGHYRYTDNGRVQRMTGPDGIDLYARVENTNQLETALCIPGWPAVTGNTLFGLNPDARYALFPPAGEQSLPLQINALPEGVFVRMCRHDDNYMLLVLDRVKQSKGPMQGVVPVTLNRVFETVSINNKTRPLTTSAEEVKLDVTFPAHILFAAVVPASNFGEPLEQEFAKLKLRKVSLATGLQDLILTNNMSALEFPLAVPGMEKPQRAITLWGPGWENNVDFLMRVPTRSAALRVYTRAGDRPYGDSTIAKLYINGTCVKAQDGRRPNPEWKSGMPAKEKSLIDADLHEWIVPIGDHVGNAILVTIASDPKRDDNCDQQWISIPVLIEDEAQQPAARVIQ
ncbi:MAG: DUF6259 domain-containing protein [Kiritimatiellae bacterium]|nr:DUF6259 domain-containing protein [Kiritimatiellia bacterium]